MSDMINFNLVNEYPLNFSFRKNICLNPIALLCKRILFPSNDAQPLTIKRESLLKDGNELVEVNSGLTAWNGIYFPAKDPQKAIVFLTGADGYYEDNFSSYFVKLIQRKFDDISVLILNYPSVNLSHGTLNLMSIQQTAVEAFNYLIHEKKFPQKKILFYGQSMGGLAAIYGALELDLHIPIICERTCANLPLVGQNLYGNGILGRIVKWTLSLGGWSTFNLKEDFKKLKGPVLIVHNPYDGVVLRTHSLYYHVKDYFKGRFLLMDGEILSFEEHLRTFNELEENLIAHNIDSMFRSNLGIR